MATIEQAMWAKITSGSAVSALIGTSMYPVIIPSDVVLPAVAYQRIATRRDMALPETGGNTLTRVTFQFACVDSRYSVTKAIADAIRQEIDSYDGTVTYTGGTVVIESILCRNENTIYTEDKNPDNSTFTTFLDAQIWYYE